MSAPLLRIPSALARPELLGGISTRVGFPSADEGDRAGARALLARALGVAPDRMAWARQVHGRGVLRVEQPGEQGEADGLIDPEGRRILLVTVADCCPVLMWQEGGAALAVAHAGWRGLVAGVLTATVEALDREGIPASALRAWIGPCIAVENFEVGPEVAERFDDQFVRRDFPRPHVDLRAVALSQLREAGLSSENLSFCADDTYARDELYWSYRRDRGIQGRQLAYLCRGKR